MEIRYNNSTMNRKKLNYFNLFSSEELILFLCDF